MAWEEEGETKKVTPKKKKRSAAYSKNKGSAYERLIVNELKEMTGNENISTSRSSSKKLDNMKIDINDEDGIFPCYFQLKKTQTTPSIKNIAGAVGKTDKPLCILWNIQIKKPGNVNITSGGEWAFIPKHLFYRLLKNDLNSINPDFVNAMMDFISEMPTGYEPIIKKLGMNHKDFYDMMDKY